MPKTKFKFAPLSGGYMATSMIGLIISFMYVYPQSETWAIASAFVFAGMFIASLLSMTYADPDEFVELERGKKRK